MLIVLTAFLIVQDDRCYHVSSWLPSHIRSKGAERLSYCQVEHRQFRNPHLQRERFLTIRSKA
jgi:hypothetical protein